MKCLLTAVALLLALPVGCASNAAGPTSAVAPTGGTSSPLAAVATQQSSATISSASRCSARDGLPDASCTPGVADPRVTQANIATTICKPGYSTSVRPPTSVTSPIKAERMAAYGYSDAPANYELDHLISLELGGHPSDVKNLWPEAYGRGEWDAARKDQVENKLHDLVCAGAIPLADAQRIESTDWKSAWTQFVGNGKTATPASRSGTGTVTPQPGPDVYYPNCSAATAAGAAPLLRGQPGYRAALDRDSDGIACE